MTDMSDDEVDEDNDAGNTMPPNDDDVRSETEGSSASDDHLSDSEIEECPPIESRLVKQSRWKPWPKRKGPEDTKSAVQQGVRTQYATRHALCSAPRNQQAQTCTTFQRPVHQVHNTNGARTRSRSGHGGESSNKRDAMAKDLPRE